MSLSLKLHLCDVHSATWQMVKMVLDSETLKWAAGSLLWAGMLYLQMFLGLLLTVITQEFGCFVITNCFRASLAVVKASICSLSC